MTTRLENFVGFQIGWFACVLSAANGISWLGLSVAALVLAVHLLGTTNSVEEWARLVVVTIIGYAWDSLLVSLDVLDYPGANSDLFAPLWIAAMWAMFATTLNSSLSWLQGRYALASLLAAIFAPLAYWAAANMGAVDFRQTPNALITQAIGWAVLMPCLLLLSGSLQRKTPQRSGGIDQ